MNDDLLPFADPRREREWLAQERAMRAASGASRDAAAAGYGVLMRALSAPSDPPPPELVEAVVARVEADARARPEPFLARIDRLLLVVPMLVFAGLFAAAIVVAGPDALRPLALAAAVPHKPWLIAFLVSVACCALAHRIPVPGAPEARRRR